MLYTPATKKALKLCFEAHKNQVDKSGLPYVFHPFHLAEQMTDEATTIAALLHDVVEDTSYTFNEIHTSDILSQQHDKNEKHVRLATHNSPWHISCERHNVSRKL